MDIKALIFIFVIFSVSFTKKNISQFEYNLYCSALFQHLCLYNINISLKHLFS